MSGSRFDDFAEHVIGLRDGGQPIPKGVELAMQFGVSQMTISNWYARLVNEGRWERRTPFDDFAEYVIGLRDGGQPTPKGVELATQFGVSQPVISNWYARLVNEGRWEPRTPFDEFAEHVIGLRDGGQPIPKGVELATQFGVVQRTIQQWYARLVNEGRWELPQRTSFDDFAEHVIGLRDGEQPIPKGVELATQFGVSRSTISQWYARLVNEGRWELPQRASFGDFAEHVFGLRDGGESIPKGVELATQFGVSQITISQWFARLVNDGRWEPRRRFDDFAEHVIGLREGEQPIPTQRTLATHFGVHEVTISDWYARLVNDGRWEPRTRFDHFAAHVTGLRDGGQPIPSQGTLATQLGVVPQAISYWYARLVKEGRWERRTPFDDFAEHVIGLRDGEQPIPTRRTLATQFGVAQGTISRWYAQLVDDGRWERPQQVALKVIAGESPAAGIVNIKDWKPGMMVSAAAIIGALDDERATLVLDRGVARSVRQLVHLNIDTRGLSTEAKSVLKGIRDGMLITLFPDGSLRVLPEFQAQPKKNNSSSPKKTTGGRRL
jgi:DNA-binding transcriptional regulator YhcF (GntR family)